MCPFLLVQESSSQKINLHYGIPDKLFVCDDNECEEAEFVSPKNPQPNEVNFVASVGSKRKIVVVCDDEVVCHGQSDSKVSKVSFE